MSTIKTYATIGIMIACFAVIYPRFMHPLFLRIFGLQDPPKPKVDNDMYPPGFRNMNPGQRPTGGQDKDDIRRHMPHGPHPGMRAAAEMHRQQAQQGSGRGMMGVVLPMYAIGIVLYLGYTLFKVFNKTNQKNKQWGNKRNYYNNRDQGYAPDRDRMGFPREFDGTRNDVRDFLQDEEQRRNLEDLLTRVDDKNVSLDEMRLLQKRLEETEAQMTRILKAMHSVQTNVDQLATDPETNSSQAEGKDEGISANKEETKGQNEQTVDNGTQKEGKHDNLDSDKKMKSGIEKDGAETETDNDNATDDKKENDDEADSLEEDETNDAFDVEESHEEDGDDTKDEEAEMTDIIMPEKCNDEDTDKNTARHRNVTAVKSGDE